MTRFVFGLLICLGLCCTALLADSPGEEAVKDAIKMLKAKRAAVKDKADQALLDTAIKDLEERLAQVGNGEPEPEAKKDEPFVMPKGWELKFNTGKARPTYIPKTGELKLTYDFADAKQIKDFEFDKEAKPQVQKGVLTIKGGEEVKHIVKFKTLTVSVELSCGSMGQTMETTGGYALKSWVYPGGGCGLKLEEGGKELTEGDVGVKFIGQNFFVPIKAWTISEKSVALKAGTADVSTKRAASEKYVGQLTLTAKKAPNAYRKLILTGIPDPEWAAEFFADKK